VIPPLSLHAWLRFDAIERLLPSDARTLLEIGAGLGSVGALLAERYEYVGLEPDATSYDEARRRVGSRGRVVSESADAFEPAHPFDVVCAFEVLEHIDDDRAAVAGWLRHARRGGWLVLSVPAGPRRFGPTDVKAGHYRRYDRVSLRAVLVDAGLSEIRLATYGFPLGYALESVRNVYAARAPRADSLDERTAASGRWLQPPGWAARLTRAGSLPFRYLQRPFANTDWGTGLVARGRVPS